MTKVKREVCAVFGCGRGVKSRNLCQSHDRHLRLWGRFKIVRETKCQEWIGEHLSFDGEECLTWPFHRDKKGVAKVTVGGVPQSAARHICERAYGPPPTHEHEAAHNCGNGHLGCVNPKHLRWATPAENYADQIIHGVVRRGEQHGMHKATEAEIIEMRRLYQKRVARSEIAAKFGLSYYTVWDITAGRSWRHI